MVNRAELRQSVTDILEQEPFAVPYAIKYYTATFNAGSYDEAYISASGALASGTGILMPINREQGGEDWKFIEQGVVQLNDSKLYMAGSMVTPNEASNIVKAKVIVSGGRVFEIIPNGVVAYPSDSCTDAIYKVAYLRLLTNGSFANEV